MTISNEVLEERLSTLQKQVSETRSELKSVEVEFEAFQKSIEAKERKHLFTGIVILGSFITTLVSIIWSYRGVIFK